MCVINPDMDDPSSINSGKVKFITNYLKCGTYGIYFTPPFLSKTIVDIGLSSIYLPFQNFDYYLVPVQSVNIEQEYDKE